MSIMKPKFIDARIFADLCEAQTRRIAESSSYDMRLRDFVISFQKLCPTDHIRSHGIL